MKIAEDERKRSTEGVKLSGGESWELQSDSTPEKLEKNEGRRGKTDTR